MRTAFTAIGLLCMLLGCTSSPVSEQYYVLGTSEKNVNYQLSKSKKVITLHTVDVADFLSEPQLIMQIGEHQIQKANYHYWAEALPDAITRELLNELRTQSTGFHFESSAGRYVDSARLTLYVTFNQFHPTDRSEVVVAGQYWLTDRDQKHTVVSQNFSYKTPLKKDGYSHAVEQLRLLLGGLSKDILTAIE